MKKLNLLKEVLEHQVYPAMGCTEPVSVALCAARAAACLGRLPEETLIVLDPGTYKNGMGVNLPNTRGEKGNLLAGAMGVLIADPELKMEILRPATPALVARAKKLVKAGRVKMTVMPDRKGSYMEIHVKAGKDSAVCAVEQSHTEVSRLEKNGQVLVNNPPAGPGSKSTAYKRALAGCVIKDLLKAAEAADAEDLAYLKKGVEMNIAASKAGMKLHKVGFYLIDLRRRGYLLDDVFSSSKILTACAADARMEGLALPVMSSGESGNQGIVATLVPWNVGQAFKIPEKKILKSIAFSHLLNGYVKVFTGGLSPICGCAIAAGVGAAGAIVYQQKGSDVAAISLAINNLISDLGGMLCDGAKGGCALKVVSSADAAIRSAYMGIHHYGITEVEGFVGKTAEQTIQNLARISTVAMAQVDPMIVDIMLAKQSGPTRRT